MTDYTQMDYEGLFEDYYALYDAPEFEVQKQVESYFYPIFLLIGSFGNIMSIIIMKQFSHNVWSTCLYLVILLILDILRLYVECGNDWYYRMMGTHLSKYILHSSNAICKVYIFTYSFLLHFSSWTVVSFSTELMIAVKYPQCSYKMCTRERARAVLLLLTVLLMSLNLHFFWTHGLVLPNHEVEITTCTYVNELSEDFQNVVWPLVDFLMTDFIPLIVVSICTCLTIVALVKRKKQKVKMEMLLQKYFLDLEALSEIQICMFTICCIFIVAEVSRVISSVITYLTINDYLLFQISRPKFELLRTSINTIQYGYISFKFIIFILICSKFRQMVKSFLLHLFRPCIKMCGPCSRQYRVALSKNTITRGEYQQGPVILRGNQRCGTTTNI